MEIAFEIESGQAWEDAVRDEQLTRPRIERRKHERAEQDDTRRDRAVIWPRPSRMLM
jgi:hypothetical protein